MKQVFLDLETTGLSTHKNGIWQIAATFYFENKLMSEFESTLRIFPGQQWDIECASMFSEEYNNQESSPEPDKVFADFTSWLKTYIDPFNKADKALLYGYNIGFDEKFLRQFFRNNNNKFFGSWFWTPSIDVMTLAAEHLKEARDKMPNFKQGTVARTLGIEVDEAKLHNALYDIQLTKNIYDIIRK